MKNTHITIDDLAALFVSEKGGKRESVLVEIEQLFADINALEFGEELSLENLGTFKKGGVGLLFKPAQTFETEINYAYAGMQSIVLSQGTEEIASFANASVSEADDETEIDETQDAAFESDELIQVVEDNTEESPENFDMAGYEKVISDFEFDTDEDESDMDAEIIADEKPKKISQEITTKADLTEQTEDPVEDSIEEDFVSEESIPKVDEKSEKAALLLVDEFNEVQKKKEKVKPKAASKDKEASETVKSEPEITPVLNTEPEEPVNRKGAIAALVLVAAVVVLAVVAVMIFNNLDDTGSSIAASDVQTESEVDSPLSSADMAFPVQPEIFQTEGSETEEQDIITQDEQDLELATDRFEFEINEQNGTINRDSSTGLETFPVYGLQGTINETISSYFSIILMSVPQENAARSFAEDLANQGYRSFAYRAELDNNRLTWRVGIGQFETVTDAVNAAAALPEPYRSNNFVVRIN